MKRTCTAIALTLVAGLALAKPPPHAPAHGYRMKHEGVDLVFDREREAYRVDGRPGVFFQGDDYYVVRDGRWYRADDLDDEDAWELLEAAHVPRRLLQSETPDLEVDIDVD